MSEAFKTLVEIVAKLRGPGGCPWDREQTNKSILMGLLEEAYEFFEAVDRNNPASMQEELGDVLLQVVLQSQICHDEGYFDIDAVITGICEKLVRRHPHVFGTLTVDSSAQVLKNWDEIKRSEKNHDERPSIVDGIPEQLPGLFRAEKVQRRVSRVGFDWQEIKPVLDKVEEEFAELRHAIASESQEKVQEELGDILFALVNVARHQHFSAEDALRRTVNKFTKRFKYIEEKCTSLNKNLKDVPLEELESFWQESKKFVTF